MSVEFSTVAAAVQLWHVAFLMAQEARASADMAMIHRF